MDNVVLWVYLLFGHRISSVTFVHCVIDEYHFVNTSLTWAGARQHCREHFTDLATVERAEDLDRVNAPVTAWIGLHDDSAAWRKVMGSEPNSWTWSATGTTSPGGYQNWIWYEPNNSFGKELCVFIASSTWRDFFCTQKLEFICYTVQSGMKEFVLVNTTNLSWMAARDHCRLHYLDLAMIESPEENQALSGMSGWIGLYRTAWIWSDGSNGSFRATHAFNGDGQCTAQKPTLAWDDESCSKTMPFVCHKVHKRSSTLKIKVAVQSSVDLSDPVVRAELLKQLEDVLQANTTRTDLVLTWDIPPAKEKDN